MKKFFLICAFIFPVLIPVYAMHIRGGELFYKYAGKGAAANTSKYTLTLKLYIDCSQNNAGQLDTQVFFTVFRKSNGTQFGSELTANMISDEFIRYDPNSNPCLTNPPTDVCYRLRYFQTTVDLPNDPVGYTVAFQRCCRIDGIINMVNPSNSVGATYSCTIPGTAVLAGAEENSSPLLNANDAVAICAGTSFSFNFSAVDPDKDSLRYTLCEAYIGGSQSTPSPRVATAPPYSSVAYSSGYNGVEPLGRQVSINPATGILSGIAPPTVGQYVVTACVYEYRQGKLINIHRKDIHIKVSDCNPLTAQLDPEYAFCDDFSVDFRNGQVNPSGTVYIWNFGDNTPPDTSRNSDGYVRHQYADTGTYKLKLTAILAGQCVDSTSSLARVYPGFFPKFTFSGSCILNAFQFIDQTTTTFGFVNKWRWDFGDETLTTDVSAAQHPTWKYKTTGLKEVRLIVSSNHGCVDTVYDKTVEVRDKPLIKLPFKDTLICSIDTLQLEARGLGDFSWTPNNPSVMMLANTANPLVYPKTTTDFTVTLNENGCLNTDIVRVRVVDYVTLYAGADTTICLTDPVTLRPSGDGLKYRWTDVTNTLNNPNIKNPVATPKATTSYRVTASIGKCDATDDVTVLTVPYPGSDAGPDVNICYDDTTQLSATIKGATFSWTPVNTLINSSSLNPLAFPLRTTAYVLTVRDNIGCPKPGRDTVIVNVRSKILADAGSDTAVVIGQPLQLYATGADMYLWEPSTGLDRNNVQSPVARLSENMTYVMKAFTDDGCFAYDTMNVRVFKTKPDIFVPNAFTPGKTTNHVFRPIPVGISVIDYFHVYNRWGQLVYSSNDPERGWDGTFAGKVQTSGTYVWMVKGRDFTGKVIAKKGTVVLIR